MKKNILIHFSFLVFLASCVVGQDGGVAPATSTSTSCVGTSVGGYCWYYSTLGQSCTTVCSTHGGYDSATESYAGMAGSDNNCNAVLTALGEANLNYIAGACAVGAGCFYDSVGLNSRARCIDTPATAAYSHSNYRRACACFN